MTMEANRKANAAEWAIEVVTWIALAVLGLSV